MNWVDTEDSGYRPAHAAPPGGPRRRNLLLDELTGLPNWLSMRERLDTAVRDAPGVGPRPAFIVLDVDGFSDFNDRYGRRVADRLLRTLATRVRALVDGRGSAYRAGADRIAIVLDQVQLGAAIETAESATALATRPLDADGEVIAASACAALVMLGERHRADAVVRDADVAMYRAKSEGRARVAVYSHQLDGWAAAKREEVRRLTEETEMLRARIEKIRDSSVTDNEDRPASGETFKTDHARLFKRHHRSGDVYSLLLVSIDRADGTDRADVTEAETTEAETTDPTRSVDESQAWKFPTDMYRTIRRAVRQGDQVYDVGDYRFAVLLPGAQGHAAVLAAERIRAAAERSGASGNDRPRRGGSCRQTEGAMTVTVVAVEAGFRHEASRDVYEEAVSLLASSEQAGPNRVVWPRGGRQEIAPDAPS